MFSNSRYEYQWSNTILSGLNNIWLDEQYYRSSSLFKANLRLQDLLFVGKKMLSN